jgi:hypothetical protein
MKKIGLVVAFLCVGACSSASDKSAKLAKSDEERTKKFNDLNAEIAKAGDSLANLQSAKQLWLNAETKACEAKSVGATKMLLQLTPQMQVRCLESPPQAAAAPAPKVPPPPPAK